MITIGIDPGQQTGFAVYCHTEKRLIELKTLCFWSAFGEVLLHDPLNVSKVVVEVPDSKHVWHKAARDLKAIQRQAVNVGGVIRESQLMAEGIKRAGYLVLTLPPKGKVDAEKFQKFTCWEGRSNGHERDAGLLCWGR